MTDMEWNLWVALTTDIPELMAQYGKIGIRAAGRTYGSTDLPPLVSEVIGLVASVGPNAYGHIQDEGWETVKTVEFQRDVAVDAIGFGGTWLAGKALQAVGGALGTALEGVGALPGAVAGYLVGSIGGSVLYDLWIGPTFVAPRVHNLIEWLHRR